jgi:hypothetical protein
MKKTTIQISVYDWTIMEEIIFETQISSLGDFVALTYRYNKKVKYKKASDKNWYYAKTMVKRLFKNEIGASGIKIKFVTSNDLNKMEEEKQKKKEEAQREEEEARRKEEEEERAWDQWKKDNLHIALEKVKSMSNKELCNRLSELYVEDYYIGKTSCNLYSGPFRCNLTETAFIELIVSEEIADHAYYQAIKFLCAGKLTAKPDRMPLSKCFRLTEDYELEYIDQAI